MGICSLFSVYLSSYSLNKAKSFVSGLEPPHLKKPHPNILFVQKVEKNSQKDDNTSIHHILISQSDAQLVERDEEHTDSSFPTLNSSKKQKSTMRDRPLIPPKPSDNARSKHNPSHKRHKQNHDPIGVPKKPAKRSPKPQTGEAARKAMQ
jgi:hypothetical protein